MRHSAVRRRHALFYVRLAEDVEPRLYGPEQVTLLNKLEREHANCRLALEWCQEQGYVEPSLRLALGLYMFWSVHGHVAKGSTRLESLLERFPARGTEVGGKLGRSLSVPWQCRPGLPAPGRSRGDRPCRSSNASARCACARARSKWPGSSSTRPRLKCGL